jgi:hypothetical protein
MNGRDWCSKYAPSIDNQDEGIWLIWMGPTLGAKMMTKLCRWNNLIQLKHKFDSEQDKWCKLEKKHIKGLSFLLTTILNFATLQVTILKVCYHGKKTWILIFCDFYKQTKVVSWFQDHCI